MQLSSFVTASLLASISIISPVSTTPLVPRDGASVVEAVNVISDHLTTLNKTVSSYTGGLLGTLTALKIETESNDLSSAIKSAIKTTTKSDPFNETESANVAIVFLTLEPQILSALDTIVSKKDAFEHGLLGLFSLSFLVKDNLEEQKKSSAELGDAVTEKLTPDYAALAPLINQEIADAFESAIEAFS